MTETALLVTDVGRRGEGIAHVDGRAYFVPGTLPGEHILAEGEGDRLGLVAVGRASPDRVAPFCQYYGRCGGCQLQHWREDPYRLWKKRLVERALSARGIAADVAGPVDAHGAGRRRVVLHARRNGAAVTAGYMEPRSHRLVDIGRCPILEPALAPAFDIGRALARRLGDCDVAVTATATGLDASVKAERTVAAREHAALASALAEQGLARLSVNGEVIATAATPRMQMGRVAVALPPGGFLQATAEGEAALSRLVVEAAGNPRRAADLFCGIGPFSARLAERASVHAFDSDRAAVAALAAAVRSASGIKPVAVARRDLFREPLVPGEMKTYDAVVFDPPRAGAEAQARMLARSAVKTVVAVSCDAESFARDAAILIEGGYALRSITAVDQFKWSAHVETVARFVR